MAPYLTYPKGYRGDFCLTDPIGIAIGRSLITGDCPAPVFADWLEENQERCQKVFDVSNPIEETVRQTILWLRKMTTHSFVE